MTFRLVFAQFVREERDKLKLTQVDLSKRAGLSQSKVSQLENADCAILDETMTALIGVFDMSTRHMLDRFVEIAGKMAASDIAGAQPPLARGDIERIGKKSSFKPRPRSSATGPKSEQAPLSPEIHRTRRRRTPH